MMALEFQIAAAMVLDLLFGDPRWLPHPVKFMGRFAITIEGPLRKAVPFERLAGCLAVVAVVGVTGVTAWLVLRGAALVHPACADVVGVLMLYTTLAARDLVKHSGDVYRALRAENLPEARERVGMLVGRDTADLDESEVSRAAVESVAENTVDGVTAPLLFAVLGGPVAAMAYKAVNTLDSTFGYRNERYLRFGWAAARLDDVANFVPARLTALLMPVAALLAGLSPLQCVRVFLRDRRRHPSPNGGQVEAAVAGALRVQLGGLNYYFGEPSSRPTMGEQHETLSARHILATNRLMAVTYFLAAVLGLCARWYIRERGAV